jgi:protein tyrosine phosphatase domain-containing protein 1
MNSVFDMVKVIDFALQEGKVAIHCHAGLGRTGVVIACYLVYAFRLTANDAILYVRSRRPNSVQTRGQMQIVQLFAEHIQPMWVVFPTSTKKSDRFTYIQYLQRQRAILHGTEARKYQRLPKASACDTSWKQL